MSTKPASILIATHDEPLGWLLAECLRLYYRCETAGPADNAAEALSASAFNLAIVDVGAGNPSQFELCSLISGTYPQTRLLMILEEGCLQEAIKLMKRRPFDHLVKPVDLSQVLRSTRRALWAQARTAARPSQQASFGDVSAAVLQAAGSDPDALADDQPDASGKSSRDRRRDERVDFLCEVQCEGASDTPFTTRMNDISVGGAFIDSMISMRVGSMLKLNFRVRAAEITAMAEVRYSMPRVGMGIRFVDLSPEQGAAIASVVGEMSHTTLSPTGAAGKVPAAKKPE